MTVTVDTDTRLVETGEIPFAELMEGVEVKMLRVGATTGTYTLMTRFAPGVQLPKHKHFGEVHAYTLAGRWRYLEYPWVAEAGSFVYEPVGSVHTLKVPDDNTEPTVVIFTIDKGMVLYDHDDQPFHIEDAVTLAEIYRGALDARGIPYPEAILP